MAEKKEKLSYVKLEAYASQLYEKASDLLKRNKELEEAVKELSDRAFYAEAGLALQCLQYKDLFDDGFVKRITGRIQEVLDPGTEEVEDGSK